MRRQCHLNFIIKPLQGNSHAKIGTNTKPYSQRAKRLAQSVLTKSPTNRASAQSVLSKSPKISIDAQCVLTKGSQNGAKSPKIRIDAQSVLSKSPKN